MGIYFCYLKIGGDTMNDILVSINKNQQIVTIFYKGTRLIKNISEYHGLTEDEIKKKFVNELKIN